MLLGVAVKLAQLGAKGKAAQGWQLRFVVALEALAGQGRPLDGGRAGGQVALHAALRGAGQAGDRATRQSHPAEA